MKRIIILGTTGSGKSFVAKKLSHRLNVPHIQLDSLFWKADWVQSDSEEFLSKVKQAIQAPEWVIDGNYIKTHELTLPLADTVVWIDFPLYMTFYQNLKRSVWRSITREELWPGTNNRESFRMLLSKESILVWLFKTYDSNRKRYSEMMNDPKNTHVKFYHLKSRHDVELFLNN